MGLIKFVCKHLMRLKNTLHRRIKVVSLKCQYGSQFKAEKFHFRSGFHVYIEDKGSITIGKNCFFNHYCSITARKNVVIGNDCIFGENIKIYDHNHQYNDNNKLIREQGFTVDDVIIGDNCWIGSNVTILKGVKIGAGSVIGAGVIVYKNIPENSVVVCKQNIEYKKG